MIEERSIRLKKFSYSNIFIIDDINKWASCVNLCNKVQDLVLCIDFALKKQLETEGYQVTYLDHLVHNDVLDRQNLDMNVFMSRWCKNDLGEDLLSYGYFNIGEGLLLNVMTDITYFCHFFFNIIAIKSLKYSQLFVATADDTITTILKKIDLKYQAVQFSENHDKQAYYFPIKTWMEEAIENNGWAAKVKNMLISLLDLIIRSKNVFTKSKKHNIYIQDYYPTSDITNRLLADIEVGVILQEYKGLREFKKNAKKIFKQRKVIYSNLAKRSETCNLIDRYNRSEKYRWAYQGHELSGYLYKFIDDVVYRSVHNAISKAKSIKKYFDKNCLSTMIPITNLWLENRLIMNYCQKNNIPIFFIANGLLNTPYLNEGRDSDYVNCYSECIKEDYFFNASNVYALGDPRMDKYAVEVAKSIDRVCPAIVIGAAGYDVSDINSYLAYEFDFLYDILQSLQLLKSQGYQFTIILKVRSNGYSNLYKHFVEEYFGDLNIQIEQNIPFSEVIKKADLYISIFSQTIFEASCLGIPAIYYKKDTQLIYRPFDGKHELVVAYSQDDLVDKIDLFYQNSQIYDQMTKKEVIEKYIGPLDGNNTKRNIDFIYNLVNGDNNQA